MTDYNDYDKEYEYSASPSLSDESGPSLSVSQKSPRSFASPWSVKGVSPAARAAAKAAASAMGMNLGAWISQIIKEDAAKLESPQDDAVSTAEDIPDEDSDAVMDDRYMQELEQKITALTQRLETQLGAEDEQEADFIEGFNPEVYPKN